MPKLEVVRSVLSEPLFLVAWLVSSATCLLIVLRDLFRNNAELGSLMKVVWALTVAYSGPLGLAMYFYSGRKQIPKDDLYRKGMRSVAHCYSGCGIGEILGLIVTVGLLSLNQRWVVGATFVCAYLIGLALTVGPLVQDGEPFPAALKDGVISESASIAVMEIVAIGVDLLIARNATIGQPIFWTSMIVSLSVGLLAAYPVNLLLIHKGVKEGMHDPRHMAQHAHAH